jgi:hypothetical protein
VKRRRYLLCHDVRMFLKVSFFQDLKSRKKEERERGDLFRIFLFPRFSSQTVELTKNVNIKILSYAIKQRYGRRAMHNLKEGVGCAHAYN